MLTSMEAASLDLWGTRLVVLSGCDTGVGEIKNGEGVYGLRRALVLAGSETQVMSLWPVSDNGLTA
jgi:CHAT domain-containing protein